MASFIVLVLLQVGSAMSGRSNQFLLPINQPKLMFCTIRLILIHITTSSRLVVCCYLADSSATYKRPGT